jgi:hypothetical protein
MAVPPSLLLSFPQLKSLTLRSASISEAALHRLLSGCPALEAWRASGWRPMSALVAFAFARRLSRASASEFCAIPYRVTDPVMLQKLVVEDAPRLERLLFYDLRNGPRTIRVMQAPALEIMGKVSEGISELLLGTTVFRVAACCYLLSSTALYMLVNHCA